MKNDSTETEQKERLCKLNTILNTSETWMRKNAELLDGTNFNQNVRNNTAAAFLTLSIEHYKGIHTLAEHLAFAPALALMRPAMESYQRGLWTHRCASDTDVHAILAGGEPPGNISKQLRDAGILVPPISEEKQKESWRLLCDFAHGGANQVKGRMRLGEIRQNIRPAYVANVVLAAATLSWLASRAIANVCENRSLRDDLDNQFSNIFPDYRKSSLESTYSR